MVPTVRSNNPHTGSPIRIPARTAARPVPSITTSRPAAGTVPDRESRAPRCRADRHEGGREPRCQGRGEEEASPGQGPARQLPVASGFAPRRPHRAPYSRQKNPVPEVDPPADPDTERLGQTWQAWLPIAEVLSARAHDQGKGKTATLSAAAAKKTLAFADENPDWPPSPALRLPALALGGDLPEAQTEPKRLLGRQETSPLACRWGERVVAKKSPCCRRAAEPALRPPQPLPAAGRRAQGFALGRPDRRPPARGLRRRPRLPSVPGSHDLLPDGALGATARPGPGDVSLPLPRLRMPARELGMATPPTNHPAREQPAP